MEIRAGRLQGKVAMITGAARRPGVAFVEAYARKGPDVVSAEINEDAASATARRV